MKVLVVDDEAPARERLSRLLSELPPYQVCGEAGNGATALATVEREQPDIVLLDIRMPGIDGLETAHRLAKLENPPAVIFTTAYGEHALEAFDAQAIGYLLKPIRKEHLAAALAKARTLNRAQLANLTETNTTNTIDQHAYISARLADRLERIPMEHVIYFQASHKYVTVRHRYGEAIIEEPLTSLESRFASRFLRIHRNALAAKSYLSGLEKGPDGCFEVTFVGIGDRLEVSRRHVTAARRFLKSR